LPEVKSSRFEED